VIERLISRGSGFAERRLWALTRSLKEAGGLGHLPNTLIIGAQKAGTTSLFTWLAQHPDVQPSRPKEVHFFDNNFGSGVAWYRSHFGIGRRSVILEASPYYLFHPAVPARVRLTLPDARLIVILRDPVDRAYSHYHHSVRHGREPLSFEDALAAERERLGTSDRDLETGRCGHSYNHQHYSYAARSLYAPQVERWLSCFPEQRFLFLDFQRLGDSPGEALSEVCRFLKIQDFSPKDVRPRNLGSYGSLDAEARARLGPRFAASNERVRQLTGVSLSPL
jgi:hypothetical protein